MKGGAGRRALCLELDEATGHRQGLWPLRKLGLDSASVHGQVLRQEAAHRDRAGRLSSPLAPAKSCLDFFPMGSSLKEVCIGLGCRVKCGGDW